MHKYRTTSNAGHFCHIIVARLRQDGRVHNVRSLIETTGHCIASADLFYK